MRYLDRLRLWLRSLLRRQRVEAELRAELEFHLEQHTAELVAAGADPREARLAARRALGDLSRYEEECRDVRRTRSLETFVQDLRYGLRALRKSPVFTVVAVLTLALGIGVNTGIFTLTDALLLRDLPVRDPGRLMAVGDPARTHSLSSGSLRADTFSVPMYRALRERSHAFSGLLASGRPGRITVGDEAADRPARLAGRLVSGNYFEVLGVPALVGRTFGADEDRLTGTAPSVVISYDYWTRRFARHLGVVGRPLLLNSHPYTIVGVAPPGFFGDVVGTNADVWVPLGMQPRLNPGRNFLSSWDTSWLVLIGRLAPGASAKEAARATRSLFAQIVATRADGAIPQELLDDDDRHLSPQVSSARAGLSSLRGNFAQPLQALTVIVALVLLIACINLANLLLERAMGRQKEISVRLALGAGRLRLVRQLLTESLLLALVGGALGMFLSFWADVGLLHLVGLRPTGALDLRPNLHVLGFTALLSLSTGLLFGLVPALHATRVELAPALRERSRSVAGARRGRWSLGRALVVSQLALSLLLLTGAGLFLRTLRNLQRLDLGYDPRGILMLEVDPVVAGHEGKALGPFVETLVARLRALPGVTGATVSENGLFSGTESMTTISIAGRPALADGDGDVAYDRVGPGYFEVVGIPILRGRGIEAGDRAGSPPVAVINESMARAYFGSADPIGQRFAELPVPDVVYEVVGVSRDAHDHDLRSEVPRRYYAPLMQSAETLGAFNCEIRTARPADHLVAPVRAAVAAIDRKVAILDLAPLSDNVAELVRYDDAVAKLASAFGLLALALAAIGLYGVVSHGVSRRTNEIGVRMVLGAGQLGVLWMVVRETMALALTGIAIGAPAALVATRAVSGRLFGVSAHDVPTLLGATGILVGIALMAGLIPGSRAIRVDPGEAIRQE